MIYLFAIIMGAIFGYISQFIASIYIEFTIKEKMRIIILSSFISLLIMVFIKLIYLTFLVMIL